MQYGSETGSLIVIWKYSISHTEANALSDQNNVYFTNDEKLFYGDKIVEDIIVVKN